MRNAVALALILSGSLALGACGDKQPSGQVVATVGKEEVTAIDLRNEMGNFSTPDPKVRRAAERQALDAIVSRKLLAQAAKKAKIDKTPEFAQQQKRLTEALLVQTWQNRLVRAVPAPSKVEVDQFIAANPDLYAAHKVLVVDQIRMARTTDPKLLAQLQPLNTIDEVQQFLVANKLQHARGASRIDALSLPPAVTTQILKLPPGEVFVIPAGNLLLVNRITEVLVEPVTGQAAANHAQQLLKSQRIQETVRRQFGSTIQQARKDVKFSKAFEPTPAKAASSPARKGAPAGQPK
jgi:peptidyl-prolyl cis-trans isomerase C